MWVVRSEMGWTRAFHNTGWPYNSILRSTYSGHVRRGLGLGCCLNMVLARASSCSKQKSSSCSPASFVLLSHIAIADGCLLPTLA